jgi:hypothetical protein
MASREAELTGIVRPEVDDRALDDTRSRLSGALDEAAQLTPDIDTRSIRRKLERAIPGGGLLGSAVDRLTGTGGPQRPSGGSAGAGSGGLTQDTQERQLEKLDDIHDEIEQLGASGLGGGGGGGLLAPRSVISGATGGAIGAGSGSLAGLLGGGTAATAGLAGAGVAGIGVGGWALSDIASGGKGFKEVGNLGESFGEQFPEMGSGIRDLFTKNPFHDLGETVGEMSWPEMPDLSGLSWPEMPDLSGLSWPDLPSLSGLSWPEMPNLSNMSWPDLPSLNGLSWPEPGWLNQLQSDLAGNSTPQTRENSQSTVAPNGRGPFMTGPNISEGDSMSLDRAFRLPRNNSQGGPPMSVGQVNLNVNQQGSDTRGAASDGAALTEEELRRIVEGGG